MNKYIDCHSHILYGIDDGAATIEDSIAILRRMQEANFVSIVLTPHYKNACSSNNSIKRERFAILKDRALKEGISIDLYLANEVRVSSDLLELIKNDEITLLGNYLFLELPFSYKIHHLDKILFEVQSSHIKIVLVHPERYPYLKLEDYQKLVDADVLLQINYESILGVYGRDVKRKVKYLLKNNLVSFVGTDIHRKDSLFFKNFDKIKKKMIKIIGEEEFERISYYAISDIINKVVNDK